MKPSDSITLPATLAQAYEDACNAWGRRVDLPVHFNELTVDHLDDLRHACLLDIADLEGVLGINGWVGRTVDEIDNEDPDAVLFLRSDCMAARRLLRWTESQLKQEVTA